MRSDLEGRLSALVRTPKPGQAEHQRAHEDALVAAFERRAAAPREPAGRRRGRRLPKIALGVLIGAGVAAGACALPAEYPVSLGQGIEITVDATRFADLEPERIAHFVGDELGAERVELHVSHGVVRTVDEQGTEVHEQVRLQLFALGGDVETEEGWQELLDEFPVLAQAEIRRVPLSGTVHGTLGGKISRELLDVTIDRHGVEEAERRILAELVAQGLDPNDATVDVSEVQGQDGERKIEVRVQAHRRP